MDLTLPSNLTAAWNLKNSVQSGRRCDTNLDPSCCDSTPSPEVEDKCNLELLWNKSNLNFMMTRYKDTCFISHYLPRSYTWSRSEVVFWTILTVEDLCPNRYWNATNRIIHIRNSVSDNHASLHSNNQIFVFLVWAYQNLWKRQKKSKSAQR